MEVRKLFGENLIISYLYIAEAMENTTGRYGKAWLYGLEPTSMRVR
jgi:hypothetical protein